MKKMRLIFYVHVVRIDNIETNLTHRESSTPYLGKLFRKVTIVFSKATAIFSKATKAR